MIKGPVLVTGANGFIASRLIPRLLAGGYHVRALVRQRASLTGRAWLPHVEVFVGSTADESGLAAALKGVHTAYYLIHSMSSGRGYVDVERQSARRFAAAAEAASVQHIIYLGGLADPSDPHLAPHMRSRIETGEILRGGSIAVTEFRAGVIAGAGSISFEMVRFLAECFPILPGPSWLRNRAQPIASENVIDYLVAGMEKAEARGGIFEMGGPEQMQFGEVLLRYARCRGLNRKLFKIPGIPIWWMALIVDRITPVPRPIATALIGGLQSDSRVVDEAARTMFPEIRLLTFEQAVQSALRELAPERLERVWEGLGGDATDFRHEGFIVDFRRRTVDAAAAVVFDYLVRMGAPGNWPYAKWMWKLRGWLETACWGQELRSQEASSRSAAQHKTCEGSLDTELQPGERRGFYLVEAMEPGQLIRMRSLLHGPGERWLEWRVEAATDHSARLIQTAFFAPRGLPGFLYWLALGPIHRVMLDGLIGAIKRRSAAP